MQLTNSSQWADLIYRSANENVLRVIYCLLFFQRQFFMIACWRGNLTVFGSRCFHDEWVQGRNFLRNSNQNGDKILQVGRPPLLKWWKWEKRKQGKKNKKTINNGRLRTYKIMHFYWIISSGFCGTNLCNVLFFSSYKYISITKLVVKAMIQRTRMNPIPRYTA